MPENEKTRVLMVVQNCPYLHDPRVRKEALALKAAGYSVAVVSPAERSEPWHQVIDEISVYGFPIWRGSQGSLGYLAEFTYSLLAIAALTIRVLLREGFDIIHVANPPDCTVVMLNVYKLMGKLIVYDQHDLCPELYAAKFAHPVRLLSRGLHWLERCAYSGADHVIVTNESYKEVCMKRGAVPESRVTVVRNGPVVRDLEAAAEDPELRRKFQQIIAFSGVIGFQDGLEYLCRALHHLRYVLGHMDFGCIVIGDGDALEHTKKLSRELGLESVMLFTGWISDPEIYFRYVFTADICAAPEPFNSYNDRSTSVKVMEYMAAGKPIAAYDLTETRRSADGAALYARPNDIADFAAQIAVLMKDADLRKSMGQAGLRRVQHELAWQYSVPNLLQAYSKVLRPSLACADEDRGQAEVRMPQPPR